MRGGHGAGPSHSVPGEATGAGCCSHHRRPLPSRAAPGAPLGAVFMPEPPAGRGGARRGGEGAAADGAPGASAPCGGGWGAARGGGGRAERPAGTGAPRLARRDGRGRTVTAGASATEPGAGGQRDEPGRRGEGSDGVEAAARRGRLQGGVAARGRRRSSGKRRERERTAPSELREKAPGPSGGSRSAASFAPQRRAGTAAACLLPADGRVTPPGSCSVRTPAERPQDGLCGWGRVPASASRAAELRGVGRGSGTAAGAWPEARG